MVIRASAAQGLAEDWRACKEWVRPDGSPDLAFMQRHFGDAVIWATDTSRCVCLCNASHVLYLKGLGNLEVTQVLQAVKSM